MATEDERLRICRLTHQLELVAQHAALPVDERWLRSTALRAERTAAIERLLRLRRAGAGHALPSTAGDQPGALGA